MTAHGNTQTPEHPHVAALVELCPGEWGTYCPACTTAVGDFVPRCIVEPAGWPPLVLQAAPPSVLLEARARAAADTHQPTGAPG